MSASTHTSSCSGRQRTLRNPGALPASRPSARYPANSRIAFGTYLRDDAAAYIPGGLDVLTLLDGRVAEIVAFLDADLTRFGLPAHVRS